VIVAATKRELLLLAGGAGFGANEFALDFELASAEGLVITDAAQTGLDLSGDHSIEMWWRPESLPNPGSGRPEYNVFCTKWGTGGNSYFYSFRNTIAPSSRYEVYVTDGANTDSVFWNVTAPSLGTYRHVAFTCDISAAVADQWKCYVDGADIGASTTLSDGGVTSIVNGTAPVSISMFRNRAADSLFQDGIMDEFRIWNTVRTSSQIADNRSAQIDPTAAGLVAYLRMNTGSGTTAFDSHANGNDFAFQNTPDWVASPLPFA